MKKLLGIAALLAFSAVITPASAAVNDSARADVVSINDPYESYNRYIFSFNQGADKYFLRPIASGYRYITPDPLRERLGHFSDNMNEPLSMVNSFFQGDFERGMKTFWRFMINSTFGIGGLNDVATSAGIPAQEEDFGQTLAVWGFSQGDYFVLPLFGPSTARDGVGIVGNWLTNPVSWALINEGFVQFGIGVGQAVIVRERFLDPIDDINDSSLDPYITYRSIYLQRRDAEIHNRNSAMPDF
ncbi:MAG: VacJ family lipoprotein [Rickettsiales bacterium]